ncbi:response regulator of citrate/malate metabolism [Leucobacter sp. UCD-THU]|uniref:response regulator transcription factor n=1 Tax=Leucobacter sp. UCD-THU TaxID=1292023 RepID=UPI0003711F41|nr:response regulator [Leucobacter sp. UCD-THU]EYT56239.1 response regulator of citrate/malate metabolism [Leucobacter sp. UCD-THU]
MTDETIRVLVVDDDPGARSLHGRFVSGTPGFSLAGTAGTGDAAVLRGRRGGIDLILLDMRLPDISGVEVLHRLRTLGARSPDVLVISSSRDQVTVRQALAAHVVGYLVKPFTQEALRERLRVYRAERRARERNERDRPLAQGEIDRLLSTGRIRVPGAPPRPVPRPSAPAAERSAPHPSRLPKGLSEVTLARIVEALDPVAPLSAAELSERCSVSRATARRYLDHLVAEGAIDLAHRYGRRGRPEVLYRLVPSPGADQE